MGEGGGGTLLSPTYNDIISQKAVTTALKVHAWRSAVVDVSAEETES